MTVVRLDHRVAKKSSSWSSGHGCAVYLYDGVAEAASEGMKFGRARNLRSYTTFGPGSGRWLGRHFDTLDEVEKAASAPWEHGMRVVDGMIEELRKGDLPRPAQIRRRPTYSEVDGDEVDMDRLRGGVPFWRTTTRSKMSGPTVVTLVIEVGANCQVRHDDVLWRGAAAVAMATLMEEAGYRVEMYSYMYSEGGYHGRGEDSITNHLQCVCLKRPQDPIDQGSLVAAVSAWFMRTVMFAGFLADPKLCPTIFLGHCTMLPKELMGYVTPDPDPVHVFNCWSYRDALKLASMRLGQLAGTVDAGVVHCACDDDYCKYPY
jgi:hypothetical protein